MQAAADLDDFLASPVGRYLAGRTFLYFLRPKPNLSGFALWGRPNEEDAKRLVQVLDGLRQIVAARLSLVDASRLSGADRAAFNVIARHVALHRDAYGHNVTRQAIVRPSNMEGAVVAGFFNIVACPFPVELVDSVEQGLAWLGASPSLAGELGAMCAEAMGTDPLVMQLRGWLEVHLAEASLSATARALGLSLRTLQRKLGEAGTSFQVEYNRVQVQVAQRLLLDTDLNLTAVALEVGCTSLQHFSDLFKRLVGLSPQAWRKRHVDEG